MDDSRQNGRSADRRKAYQKPSDHISSRSADERDGGGGGGGGSEGMRGNRDWPPRGSPHGKSFSSYRNMEEEFYAKEQMYKSDKPPRPPYQRHDTKPKRRDGGDYHSRSRHSEFGTTEEPLRRTLEDKRQGSPGRERSKKTSRRYITPDKHEKENTTENTVSSFHCVSCCCILFRAYPFLAINAFIFPGSQVKRKICYAKRVDWMC